MSTPHYVLIERNITEDEIRASRDYSTRNEALAAMFGARVVCYLDAREGDDPSCVETAVYMYARRAAHWALAAQDAGHYSSYPLCTYYHAL